MEESTRSASTVSVTSASFIGDSGPAHPAGGDDRLRVGISSCLMGNKVRFDGGHKHDPYITGTLGQYMDFVPVCPEVECGMPVPREALRLVGDPASPRLVTVKGYEDWTERMRAFALRRVEQLAAERLDGFIFKRASPSSGMERVKVYADHDPREVPEGAGRVDTARINLGPPQEKGVGIFARVFMDRFPLLPTEEEGRLNDPRLRENFIERLFVMRRWRALAEAGLTRGGLVDFHTRHKLLLMSHSVEHYRALGRLVAHAASHDPADLARDYLTGLMDGLRLPATTAKHANVLQHCMGYFKRVLTPDEKLEMLEVIQRYRKLQVPLVVPVTLLNHYVRKYGEPYLAGQFYLNPHPVELKLRNHA
ncbi:YbgA family protein [Nitratidesulfovibrio termitidis]|uniref:YbgA family protein n=1 Tax=Nitratidesulfovibrio termitidis TaxID=42252 RepID=UPI00041968F4|nr:DUF523 and DUF1722 domain-containing protein [Nitratidesulfovibrio termitidis]